MIDGIDLSHFNGPTPRLTGLGFVFVKATQALFTDPMWATHAANVQKAGVILGAYHFGDRRADAGDQARYFLKVASPAAKLFALDVEGTNAPTGPQIREFIDVMHKAGKRVGIYGSESGFPVGLGADFNWIAKWGATEPRQDWTFWQYSSTGHIAGHVGAVDMDRYAGDLESLRRLAGLTTHYTVSVRPGAVFFYDPKTYVRARHLTGGFSADCTAPIAIDTPYGRKRLVRVLSGSAKAYALDADAWNVNVKEITA